MGKIRGNHNTYTNWESASRASEKGLTKVKSGLAASSRKVEVGKVQKWFSQFKKFFGFGSQKSEISSPDWRVTGHNINKYKSFVPVGPKAKHPGNPVSADENRELPLASIKRIILESNEQMLSKLTEPKHNIILDQLSKDARSRIISTVKAHPEFSEQELSADNMNLLITKIISLDGMPDDDSYGSGVQEQTATDTTASPQKSIQQSIKPSGADIFRENLGAYQKKLATALKRDGLTRQKAPNDGDCFYHSIGKQTGMSQSRVRRKVDACAETILYAAQASEDARKVITDLGLSIEELSQMRENNEIRESAVGKKGEGWADINFAQLVAIETGRPVVVYAPQFNDDEGNIAPVTFRPNILQHIGIDSSGSPNQSPIHLVFSGGGHFDYATNIQ